MTIITATMIRDMPLNDDVFYDELGFEINDIQYLFIDCYGESYTWDNAWFINSKPIIL